jgi:superfamily II DNA or RNA helicase
MSKILDNIKPEEVKELSDKLSFAIQGARFSEAFIKGRWDGRKRLFSSTTYQFPTGLCHDVKKILKNYKIDWKFEFKKPDIKSGFDVPFEFPHPLRDYQVEASNILIGAVKGIMVMGTGGGKTITALKVIQHYGLRSLFLVNTKEALYDTVRAAELCLPKIKIGILGDGKNKDGVIVIATVASIYRKVINKEIDENKFDLIVADEIHHMGADSWVKAIKYFNAVYKYGMTGTAFRTDGSSMMLRAMTGPICFNMPSIELQNKGYLAKSKIYFIDCDKPNYLDRPLEYRELYDEGLIKNYYNSKHQVLYYAPDTDISFVKRELDKIINL